MQTVSLREGTPPKTNMDARNAGVEKVSPFKHGNSWYVRFLNTLQGIKKSHLWKTGKSLTQEWLWDWAMLVLFSGLANPIKLCDNLFVVGVEISSNFLSVWKLKMMISKNQNLCWKELQVDLRFYSTCLFLQNPKGQPMIRGATQCHCAALGSGKIF